MDAAAEKGDLEEVKRLHASGASCTRNAMNWAACNGHHTVIQSLHKNRTDLYEEGTSLCTVWAMVWAAQYGHIKVVQWLHENRTDLYEGTRVCTVLAMDSAAMNGHL